MVEVVSPARQTTHRRKRDGDRDRERAKGDAPGEAPDERDELVEVGRAEVAERGAEDDAAEAEEVLLPLDDDVLLPATLEEAVLHDSHRREELKWDRQEDRKGVQELHLDDCRVSCFIVGLDGKNDAYRLRELAGGVEVDDDDSLHVGAEREVRHSTTTTEKNCKPS